MRRHSGHRGWHFAGGPAYARAVEQNHFPIRCQRIGDCRIPVVQCPGEVLETQQRASDSAANPPIRVRFGLTAQELRRSGDVAVVVMIE